METNTAEEPVNAQDGEQKQETQTESKVITRDAIVFSKDIYKNDDLKEAMTLLLKVEGNSTCADCGASIVEWGSVTFGVFLCIQCSGYHRTLGTHISRIKSLFLDNWKKEELEVCILFLKHLLIQLQVLERQWKHDL
jgi:hypothetical protein